MIEKTGGGTLGYTTPTVHLIGDEEGLKNKEFLGDMNSNRAGMDRNIVQPC